MNNFAQGFAIIFHGGSLSKVDFDKSVNSSYQLENHRLKCAKNILRYPRRESNIDMSRQTC